MQGFGDVTAAEGAVQVVWDGHFSALQAVLTWLFVGKIANSRRAASAQIIVVVLPAHSGAWTLISLCNSIDRPLNICRLPISLRLWSRRP